MIDSIKLLIPIENTELLLKLRGTLTRFRKEDLKRNSIEFEFYASNIELGSYERTVAIKSTNNPQGFFVEFSVPKYVKGNNVEMLHPEQLRPAMERLYTELCVHMEHELPHFTTWPVYRLDICYNWILKNYEEAQHSIDFIKLIDFPRKKKHVWDTSVMYQGTAYTVKFYLKGPEFQRNDFKKVNSDEAPVLQEWANKILRFEIALKRIYLEEFLGLDKVYIDDLTDIEKTEEMLIYYLDKVFKYTNNQTMENAAIKNILFSHFSNAKATRLYSFYKDFYFNDEMKTMYMHGGLNRSTIYRNKRDLKAVGIGISKELIGHDTSALEKLQIPSPAAKFDLLDYS